MISAEKVRGQSMLLCFGGLTGGMCQRPVVCVCVCENRILHAVVFRNERKKQQRSRLQTATGVLLGSNYQGPHTYTDAHTHTHKLRHL